MCLAVVGVAFFATPCPGGHAPTRSALSPVEEGGIAAIAAA